MPKRGRAHPGLERLVVRPARDDQPGGSLVGRFEQLEALKAGLVVDGTCTGSESASQLVAAFGGNGDRVDGGAMVPAVAVPPIGD